MFSFFSLAIEVHLISSKFFGTAIFPDLPVSFEASD